MAWESFWDFTKFEYSRTIIVTASQACLSVIEVSDLMEEKYFSSVKVRLQRFSLLFWIHLVRIWPSTAYKLDIFVFTVSVVECWDRPVLFLYNFGPVDYSWLYFHLIRLLTNYEAETIFQNILRIYLTMLEHQSLK